MSLKHASRLQAYIEKRWYGKPGILLALSPLEWVFSRVANKRKTIQKRAAYACDVPLVVVGNISVGGTGKTPTIIALIKYLQRRGMKPGVVSRGYGRTSEATVVVTEQSECDDVGDEPLLIYLATNTPVAVAADRKQSIDLLVSQGCNLILADDGLQHYAMARDKEIVVVDGERMFGNGHLLPVGPLREHPTRLNEADWVLVNFPEQKEKSIDLDVSSPVYPISIKVTGLTRIATGEKYPLEHLARFENIVAIVGLGNPNKFFHSLDTLGVRYERKVFPDHHRYSADDFASMKDKTILMTEKDAVKCKKYVGGDAYCLNVEMQIPMVFLDDLYNTIN